MIIVGVAGMLQSGKDTWANRLIERYGFIRLPFAGPLKREILTNLNQTLRTHYRLMGLGWDWDDAKWTLYLSNRLWVEKDEFTRALLQEYGTEVRRGDDLDYWVKQWETSLQKLPDHARIVSTDLRFRNEAMAVKRYGGKLVKVIPPQTASFVRHEFLAHASERDLESWTDWDFVAQNRGGIRELQQEADEFISTLSLQA